jgi:hypothetical protein
MKFEVLRELLNNGVSITSISANKCDVIHKDRHEDPDIVSKVDILLQVVGHPV